jgi:signal transduction histidine kinase
LTAYRVVEEALGNAVKHGGATSVEVVVGASDEGLQVAIADNGRGFDQSRVQPGLGLGSISARVGRVGGTWTISSAPGVGTRMAVLLPLARRGEPVALRRSA